MNTQMRQSLDLHLSPHLSFTKGLSNQKTWSGYCTDQTWCRNGKHADCRKLLPQRSRFVNLEIFTVETRPQQVAGSDAVGDWVDSGDSHELRNAWGFEGKRMLNRALQSGSRTAGAMGIAGALCSSDTFLLARKPCTGATKSGEDQQGRDISRADVSTLTPRKLVCLGAGPLRPCDAVECRCQ
jgi:hypothetical protein